MADERENLNTALGVRENPRAIRELPSIPKEPTRQTQLNVLRGSLRKISPTLECIPGRKFRQKDST